MTEEPTMRDVDHTHPFDDRSAGEVFLRGPTVVADGGYDSGPPIEESGDVDERTVKPTMRDVDHTPRHGDGVNRVLERGAEHGTDPVVGTDVVGPDAVGADERRGRSMDRTDTDGRNADDPESPADDR